jgi:hypothetical protein
MLRSLPVLRTFSNADVGTLSSFSVNLIPETGIRFTENDESVWAASRSGAGAEKFSAQVEQLRCGFAVRP